LELVLVERRFSRPTRFEDIQALEDEGAWCLKAHGVRFLRTFFSRDGKRMLCLYEAPDAEAVRLAETQAKVPFDNVWTCARLHSDRPAVFFNTDRFPLYRIHQFTEPVFSVFCCHYLHRHNLNLEMALISITAIIANNISGSIVDIRAVLDLC